MLFVSLSFFFSFLPFPLFRLRQDPDTLLAERFPDFTNDLRQFCEVDARRSPYGTILIATMAARLFIYRLVYNWTSDANDYRLERVDEKGEQGRKTSALFSGLHASTPPGTPRWTRRPCCTRRDRPPSTNSLTDSWPHLQCIEKRGGVRSIRAACLARPGPARYWILRGRLAARHVVSDRRSARTERHVARFNF